MLLRVLRPISGSVDGIDLTAYDPGRIYRFSTELAAFVMAIGAAEPVDGLVIETTIWPAKKRMFDSRQLFTRAALWHGEERRSQKR
jgi:hypothetical protein